ncbi:MAG: chemotaxis protein CheB [Gemmataceae bacterium]
MAEEDPTPATQPDRQAQPVDAEQPPRLPFPVVGIGASAGGLEAVGEFFDVMRPDGGMAYVLVQHLPPDHHSMIAEILARRTGMPVRQVEDGMPVEPDHVYVIRPGHVLTLRDGRLHLGPRLGSPRAANRPIDDFFKSLAEEQRERAIAVVMSGMGSNGTAGAQAVKAVGRLCIAQDPETAQFPSMPRHLIDAGYADHIARPADMPELLLGYADQPYARGGREADAPALLSREQHHLREILAVLRSRTRQDFSGYKKPTVLRRVQRRMGLARTAGLAEYARLLRQNPAEVQALADDLLIHVTGFFRDPDAWEVFRERAVVPLVAAREYGATVRAWVTACSSGEEAYTLAMLLVEEADRAGKHLDIKVFATDLADRSLAHARSGVYPGGIESEITADRLARFFTKDDEVYRVRQELRDRVVFAPQNVLQDPPFSRLDLATCRNLLIYLEPDVQRRVLSLLHFGLREGGTLFLGTSETIAGAEELFEPVDKKARIYRRVGPTRHGAVEFPLPHGFPAGGPGAGGRGRRADGGRPSVAQITQHELLSHHTPAAVAVDRDYRVLYFHGDTRAYLVQPTGEPTRDLLLLARDGVRPAVRVALHRAAAEGVPATAADGWADAGNGRQVRVAVTASPAPGVAPDGTPAPPDYFVVSFADHGNLPHPAAPAAGNGGTADEFRRLRAELQSTIEELQTSNEELKASNEEVMSVNEELQSANEELESSKEEMQSLNEELNTVNSQLRAKMEEYQTASSDLTSLLASTDIAVLFLDTSFRIRRFTPAARDLVDLIPGDVGRPLAALARRFDDPHLDNDCRAVLERLVPAEREVAGADGRHYLRRVLPYRTTDNRIDGVVVTFVDITARKAAEAALRENMAELTRFNQTMVSREERMIELKREVNALCQRLGQPGPYPLEFDAGGEGRDG